ncbi:MAG: dihydrofolate reductase family protein [Thermoplasmata archaeon]
MRGGYTGEEDKPMLHLVSRGVPLEYLQFLRDSNIPYLMAGEDRVELEQFLEKMKEKLNVKTVLTSSGGRLSGALLKKGILDEVYIRFNPVIIGGFHTPTLFASPDLGENEWPRSLQFVEGEIKETGHISIRYRVER